VGKLRQLPLNDRVIGPRIAPKTSGSRLKARPINQWAVHCDRFAVCDYQRALTESTLACRQKARRTGPRKHAPWTRSVLGKIVLQLRGATAPDTHGRLLLWSGSLTDKSTDEPDRHAMVVRVLENVSGADTADAAGTVDHVGPNRQDGKNSRQVGPFSPPDGSD